MVVNTQTFYRLVGENNGFITTPQALNITFIILIYKNENEENQVQM